MIACGAEWDDEDATLEAQEHRPDNKPLVQVMLTHGASVNVKDAAGETPLMWAVTFDRLETVGVLLDHRANLATQDKNGWTVLHHAVSYTNEVRIIKRLLEDGANPNSTDKDGGTPLTFAELRPDIVILLKQYEAKK